MQSFDDIFDTFGHFNSYQLCTTLCVFCAYFWCMPSPVINYIAGPMEHFCDLSQVESEDTAKSGQLYVPKQDNKLAKCYYSYNISQFEGFPHVTPGSASGTNVSDVLSAGYDNIYCDAWTFDRSEFESTIVSKYDLVCGREWLISLLSTLFLCGSMFGVLFGGYISDRFGRLKSFGLLLFLISVSSLGSCFAPYYSIFAILRFFVGVGSYVSPILILSTEEVGPRYRSHVIIGSQICYCLGFMLMTGVGYMIRNDTYFQLAIGLPTFTYFLFFLIYVESPRWLIVKGDLNRARKGLVHMFGKRHEQEILNLDLKAIQENECAGNITKSVSWTALFKVSRLRRGTLTIHYMWAAVSLVWYAISLNSAALSGNFFLVNFLLALVELPAGLLCLALCQWRVTGRKLTASLSLMLAGACGFVCVPLLALDMEAYTTPALIVAKFCISMAWSAMVLFSTELYPTEVRNSAMGSSQCCAYLAGAVGPFIGGPLRKVSPALPFVIYGVMGVSAAVLGLFLPETRDKQLCDTIEDAARYGFVKSKTKDYLDDKQNGTDINKNHDSKKKQIDQLTSTKV